MREFVYFSSKARTSGNFEDLMQAGRMDIVCNFIIHSFFVSHNMREDVKLHLIFYGSPDPPKHIEIIGNREIPFSKKDIIGFIKKMLYKYKQGQKTEVFPGCFIEKKSLFAVLEELKNQGKEIYVLEGRGEDLRKIETERFQNSVFLFGDHQGLPLKELKRLKKEASLISLGKTTYFASQALTILQNELDRRREKA